MSNTSSQFPDIDSILDSLSDTDTSTAGDITSGDCGYDFLDGDTDSDSTNPAIQLVELAPDEIDPRLLLLSHSSRTTLHKCPRKFQLYRLSAQKIALEAEKEVEQGVTFAYGHAVGEGIEQTLAGHTEDQVLLATFLAWDEDLDSDNPKQNKSFYLAFHAVQKFLHMRMQGYLADYDIVYYEECPAIELGFQILLPDGFVYRGFVDAVLKNKETGEVVVVECKTTSSTAQSAMYKNSGQALGYSIVLDKLFPGLSSYTVLYLVYESKSYEYKELPFGKSLLQRALWLQELLIDCDMIKLYESYGTYPMHGESCFDFFRECEYLGVCTLHTKNLTKPLTTKIVDDIAEDTFRYPFTVTFSELITDQMERA